MTIGLCQCGCGEATSIAKRTYSRRGWFKGQPVQFVSGHNARRTPNDYEVDPETNCWVWLRTTYRSRGGGLYGHKRRGKKLEAAHRVYYEAANGPIPPGLTLDHLCRNTLCVNPKHLEPVTHAENCRRGSGTKLTAADVRAIRASDLGSTKLAPIYGVSASTIRDARTRNWKAA